MSKASMQQRYNQLMIWLPTVKRLNKKKNNNLIKIKYK